MTVSSAAHKGGAIHFNDLQNTRNLSNAYGGSKLANLLFTYELDRRLGARGLGCQSCCLPSRGKIKLTERRAGHGKFKTSLVAAIGIPVRLRGVPRGEVI